MQQAIWMEGAPVVLLAGAGTAQSLKYVQPDHLGTPRAVIDPRRNVAIWTWDAKSEAFGNSPPNQDPDLDGTAFVFNMRFPGQRYDPANGLVYNYFRDYDPATGRYIQSDPVGLAAGASTYSYTGGAPLMAIDRFGLAASVIVEPSGIPGRGFIAPRGRDLILLTQAFVAGGATVSSYATGAALLPYSPSLGTSTCEASGNFAACISRTYSTSSSGSNVIPFPSRVKPADSCPPDDGCERDQKKLLDRQLSLATLWGQGYLSIEQYREVALILNTDITAHNARCPTAKVPLFPIGPMPL